MVVLIRDETIENLTKVQKYDVQNKNLHQLYFAVYSLFLFLICQHQFFPDKVYYLERYRSVGKHTL